MATSVPPLELLANSNSEFQIDKLSTDKSSSVDRLHSRNGVTVTHEDECKNINEEEVKVKKKVNIFTEEPNETTALRKDSEVYNLLGIKAEF